MSTILILGLACGFCGAISAQLSAPEVSSPAKAVQENAAKRPLNWVGHWKGEGLRQQLVEEVLDEYSFMHPEVDVRMTYGDDLFESPQYKGMARRIVEMIRSGEYAWDVVRLDPWTYSSVAAELDDPEWGEKYLVDFAEVPGFPETQKPFLMEGPDAHRYTGGVCPGPYIEGFLMAVWYNQALAERLGIDIDEEQMSPEDLLAYAATVHAYNRTADVPVETILDFGNGASFRRLFYSLFYSALPEMHTPHSLSEKAIEPAIDRTLSYMERLAEYETVHPDVDERSWEEAGRLMLEGRGLLMIDGTWLFSGLAVLDPERLRDLRLAAVPGFDGKNPYIGGYISSWGVLKHAPGASDGIDLLKFWSTPQVAERWVRYTKNPTGIAGSLYDAEYGQDVLARFVEQQQERQVEIIMDPGVIPYEEAIQNRLNEAIESTMTLLSNVKEEGD